MAVCLLRGKHEAQVHVQAFLVLETGVDGSCPASSLLPGCPLASPAGEPPERLQALQLRQHQCTRLDHSGAQQARPNGGVPVPVSKPEAKACCSPARQPDTAQRQQGRWLATCCPCSVPSVACRFRRPGLQRASAAASPLLAFKAKSLLSGCPQLAPLPVHYLYVPLRTSRCLLPKTPRVDLRRFSADCTTGVHPLPLRLLPPKTPRTNHSLLIN